MSTTVIPIDSQLLTVPETAHALRSAERKVWELVASGDLVSVKIGRRRLVPRWAVDQFVERLAEEQNPALRGRA